MYFEKTVSSEAIFEGRILNLRVDTVELPDGKLAKREIVDHKNAVAILAIEGDCVCFVQQFRPAIGAMITEIPAGLVEPGEDVFETAQRELQEEIGLKPLDLQLLGDMIPSAGFSNEVLTMFLATRFENASLPQDEDEFLRTVKIPIETVRMLFDHGKFTDAKTACALGRYFSKYNGELSF